jgi:ribosomal protein S27E
VQRLRPLTDADREVIDHDVPMVLADPAWCQWCSADIKEAIWGIPDLVAGLWAAGHEPGDGALRVVVGPRCVEVLDRPRVRPDLAQGPPRYAVTERLSCGHTTTRVVDVVAPAGFTARVCWRCRLADPGASGRLMPAGEAARHTRSVPGSPALSPSWLAVEELISWVGETEDYLRARLGHPPSPRDWWVGDETARTRTMTASVRYLAEWHNHLLETRHAVEIGQRVLHLRHRAVKAAGLDRAERLRVPCPVCDRRALWREYSAIYARCRSCGTVKLLEDVDYLAAVTGAAG